MSKKYIIATLAILLLPLTLGAQGLRGSYFLDNSIVRTKLNPAFSPRANYFQLPVLSNTGVGVYGNIGASNVLYPMDGSLYLFLNKNVSADQFVNSLPAMPGIDISFDTNLLSFGFYGSDHSFWSVETGLTVDASVGLPKEFLEFAKRGPENGRVYSLKGFNIYANASLYASLGYSRDLSDVVKGLKIGAKARLLIPAAEASVDLGNSTITADNQQLLVNTDATGTLASTFFRLIPAENAGEAPQFEFLTKYAPAGYGFGIDLGAEYRLSVGSVMDGLTFSFSVLNLGAKFYKAQNLQKLASKGNVVYTGAENITFDENSNIGDVFTKLGEDFVKLGNFTDVSDDKDATMMTRPTFNFGVEYPFVNDKMSVGLLYTLNQRMNRTLSHELTVSYNLNPCKWFNLGVNYSFLNVYKSVGWILEFSPKAGVDFFIGTDFLYTEMMPKLFLPVDKLWTNVNFGLTLMLGSKHAK